MCDLDQAELGEYLLWTEAARAKARALAARTPPFEREDRRTLPVGTGEAVEA